MKNPRGKPDSQVISRTTLPERTSKQPGPYKQQLMAEESSDNAFSFGGHAVAPAAGTQSNSSQSIDTGGSETSELRAHIPRRQLIAARERLPTMQAIEDADSTPGKRRSSARQQSPPMTPRTKARTTSSHPPSPIQDVTPSGVGSYQRIDAPSSGSDIFTAYQGELSEYKISLWIGPQRKKPYYKRD